MLQEIESYQQLVEPFLHEICDACHATSAWLLKHDFNRRIATVVAEYASETANFGEKTGEIIGEQYPEGIQSAVWPWLRSLSPQALQFHTTDIPTEQLEHLEYIEDNVQSVLCFAVYRNDAVWGFVEVWETRHRHDFTATEIEAATPIVRQLETALKEKLITT